MLDFLDDTATSDAGRPRRKVRSFVLREGRLTRGQQRALEELWPLYGLERRDGVIEPEQLFPGGAQRPLVLDIGYGMGEALLDLAERETDKNFIGMEVHRPGVGGLLLGIEKRQLTNLRTYCDDAVEVIDCCIPDDSLERVQLFFPDPWPKKKHHKRRIVQPDFLRLLYRKLQSGGVLHMATDWADYAEHMREVLSELPEWHNPAGDRFFSPRPDWRPRTRFEQRGENRGHEVHDVLLEKR